MKIPTTCLCKSIQIHEDISNGSTSESKAAAKTQCTPLTFATLQSLDNQEVKATKTVSMIWGYTISLRGKKMRAIWVMRGSVSHLKPASVSTSRPMLLDARKMYLQAVLILTRKIGWRRRSIKKVRLFNKLQILMWRFREVRLWRRRQRQRNKRYFITMPSVSNTSLNLTMIPCTFHLQNP